MSYSALVLESRTLAINAFRRARSQATREMLWSKLRRQSADLDCFQDVSPETKVGTDEHLSYAEIALDNVVGSVERCSDYTRSFLPLKDSDQARWTRVRAAFAESKPLPPIRVVQVGQIYYVVDGHHRVSVAKHLGLQHLAARVQQAHTPGHRSPADQSRTATNP